MEWQKRVITGSYLFHNRKSVLSAKNVGPFEKKPTYDFNKWAATIDLYVWILRKCFAHKKCCTILAMTDRHYFRVKLHFAFDEFKNSVATAKIVEAGKQIKRYPKQRRHFKIKEDDFKSPINVVQHTHQNRFLLKNVLFNTMYFWCFFFASAFLLMLSFSRTFLLSCQIKTDSAHAWALKTHYSDAKHLVFVSCSVISTIIINNELIFIFFFALFCFGR